MIDNEKNETRKNEKQTKEELLEKHALNDDDLEKVSGGGEGEREIRLKPLD